MSENIIFYCGVLFVTAFIGGVTPLLIAKKNERIWSYFVSLGGGVLLGMAMIHLLPQAAGFHPKSFGLWVLLGFLLLFIVERFVMVHACDEHGCHYHTIGTAAFLGLALHGFIEGAALASSMLITNMAPMVLVAIILHKAPANIALTSILKLANKSHKSILYFILGTALSSPVGLLVSVYLLDREYLPSIAGNVLALSAGTFIYIACCDILPELHRESKDKTGRLFIFLMGIAISVVGGA